MLVQAKARAGRRRGGVAVWVVLSLATVLSVVALAMDGGRMMDERRHSQAAADAAALAAAANLYNNYQANQGADSGGTAQKAALAAAASNGYANDGYASTVTVNIPPQSGSFKGQAGYAEVLVRSTIPAGFGSAWLSGGLTVRARAVARGQPRPIGVLLLQSSGPDALSLSGNASLAVARGSLVVNSTSSLAVSTSGNATLSAPAIDLASTSAPALALSLGSLTGRGQPTVSTGVPPTADPLQSLTAPDATQYTVQSTGGISATGNGTLSLQPGVYQGGISVSGNASVTLAAGVYILEGGGFQVSGNGSVTGSGVLIYNTTGSGGSAGAINLSGNGGVSLTPPTSGIYAGIGFFQDRSVTAGITLSGNGTLDVPGVVYAPAAAVQLSGNAGADSTQGGGFIAASLTASGNATVNVNPRNYYTRVPDVRLVE